MVLVLVFGLWSLVFGVGSGNFVDAFGNGQTIHEITRTNTNDYRA
jgi:hypothetical protein